MMQKGYSLLFFLYSFTPKERPGLNKSSTGTFSKLTTQGLQTMDPKVRVLLETNPQAKEAVERLASTLGVTYEVAAEGLHLGVQDEMTVENVKEFSDTLKKERLTPLCQYCKKRPSFKTTSTGKPVCRRCLGTDPIRTDPSPQRNKACPCGSGLKYKKCHGRS